MSISNKINNAFTAGAFGGLVNSIAVWAVGALGVSEILKVNISPELTKSFIYPKIIIGGAWGVLLFLPILRKKVFLKGVVLSFGPTLTQLFIIFPFKTSQGILGLELGKLTPLLVFLFNSVWGISAVWWYMISGNKNRRDSFRPFLYFF